MVSGFTLKLIRESTGLTQSGLAEHLRVDLATIQGWESGRRPLTSLRSSDLSRLRLRLISLGAPPASFAVLRDAVDADVLIADTIEACRSPESAHDHALALVVHRRDLTSLITWPFTGNVPDRLRALAPPRATRRGPTADRPTLTSEEKVRFFDHLLVTADASTDQAEHLLRRQSIYLLGFDDRDDTQRWLLDEQRAAVRSVGRNESVDSWVTVRSSAVALAQNGDLEPLHGFVKNGLADHQQELANLNYWAYWVGEIDELHTDDRFMTGTDGRWWAGVQLFEHLIDRTHVNSQHLALNAHTLWALMIARPRLLDDQPALRTSATGKLHDLLDMAELPAKIRQELASVTYAIRLASR